MLKKKTKKKANGGLTVDFSGIEDRKLVPEGDWPFKVESVEETESSSGNAMLKWVLTVNQPKDKKVHGAKLFVNTSLTPQALWNLRNLLLALGVDVPSSAMELDLEEYVGLEGIATVEHEKYEGRLVTRVTGYAPLDSDEEEADDEEVEVEDDDEEEESDDAEESDDDEEEEESDDEESELEAVDAESLESMTLKQLTKLVTDYDLDVDLDSMKTTRKKVSAIKDALEEKELLAK